MKIELSRIKQDENQPRKNFTNIDELAESIKSKGLLHPITVRPEGDHYVIISGERRYRASIKAGLTEIEATVLNLDEVESFKISVLENLQREDLTPVEEAKTFQQLQDMGMSQAEMMKLTGKSQSYISQKLRLLKLPDFLQIYMDEGNLTENHSRQLLRLAKAFPPDLKIRGLTLDKLKEYDYVTRDSEVMSVMFYMTRPVNNAPLIMFGDLTREAFELYLNYVLKHKNDVPQWQQAALYFAAMAQETDATVNTLSKLVSNFIESYHGSIAVHHLLTESDDIEPALRRAVWGELKQNNSLIIPSVECADDQLREWWIRLMDKVLTEDSFALPFGYSAE